MAVTTGEWSRHLTAVADYVENVIVQGFLWHAGTAVGHTCKVLDSTGNEAFEARLSAANVTVSLMLHTPVFYKRLTLDTLGSGEFLIYVI